jgi:hypothetical protein
MINIGPLLQTEQGDYLSEESKFTEQSIVQSPIAVFVLIFHPYPGWVLGAQGRAEFPLLENSISLISKSLLKKSK